MENYILRIYKRDRRDPRKMVGVVESVGGRGRGKFSSPETLWKILSARKGDPVRGGKAAIPGDKTVKHMRMGEIMKIIGRENRD